jgi:hypothetical protein
MKLPLRLLRVAGLAATLVAAAATSIDAQIDDQAVVSPLNCQIGAAGCTEISTFGTLTFFGSVRTGFRFDVDSTVQTDPLTILTLFLNVNESTVATGTQFTLRDFIEGPVLDTFDLTAFNTQQAGACSTCLFDIRFDIAANTVFEPDVLIVNGGGLITSDVLVPNAAGLDAAIRFGNCNVLPCANGEIIVGERFTSNVPEPASVLLLCVSLAALSFRARRSAVHRS